MQTEDVGELINGAFSLHRSALSLMFFDNLVGVGGEYVEKVESVYMVKC